MRHTICAVVILFFTPAFLTGYAVILDDDVIAPALSADDIVFEENSEALRDCPVYRIDHPRQITLHNDWRGEVDYSAQLRFCWTPAVLAVRIDVADDINIAADDSGGGGDSIEIGLRHLTCGPDRTSRDPWTIILQPNLEKETCGLVLRARHQLGRKKLGKPSAVLLRTEDGYSILLTLPHSTWDDSPRHNGTTQLQIAFHDSDEAGSVDHRFIFFPISRGGGADGKRRDFGKIKYVGKIWARAVPETAIFCGRKARLLLDCGNLTDNNVSALVALDLELDTEDAGDLTEKLKGLRVIHTIAAGSIEQNVPLEFDFSGLPTERYRIKSKADIFYDISSFRLNFDRESGLIYSRGMIERRRQFTPRKLAINENTMKAQEVFRHMAGGGRVVWSVGRYDASSNEFPELVRCIGPKVVKIPGATAKDIPWALFGGADKQNGMSEPLVLRIDTESTANATGIGPDLPLYNYDRQKKRIAIKAKRLLLIGVALDYVDTDTAAEIHIFTADETLLKERIRPSSHGGPGSRHAYVFRVWLDALTSEVRIENSTEYGGKFEIDFLAFLAGSASTKYPRGKPSLTFGGTPEAFLFNKQLPTSLFFMRNGLIGYDGTVYSSLPGGRYGEASMGEFGALLSELSIWGYIETAKSLVDRAADHLTNETTGIVSDETNIGRALVLSGLYHLWRKTGGDIEIIRPIWLSAIHHPITATIQKISTHPLGLIDSGGDFGATGFIDGRRVHGATVPGYFATQAAMKNAIVMAEELQYSESAIQWQRVSDKFDGNFQRRLVISGRPKTIVAADAPGGGIFTKLPPNSWMYGYLSDGKSSPVLFNDNVRVFDTPFALSGLSFWFDHAGFNIDEATISQMRTTYEYLIGTSEVFQKPAWHQFYIIDYHSSLLQLWTIMAGLVADNTTLSSRMLQSFIQYSFDEFAPLPDTAATGFSDIEISPYTFEEKLNVAQDGNNAGASKDDLNILNGTAALKTARLIAGIDDYDAKVLQLTPRLPENWQVIEANNWLVAHAFEKSRVQQVFYKYERTARDAYKLDLTCNDKLTEVTVRVGPFEPRTRKVQFSNFEDRENINTFRSGNAAWAVNSYRQTKTLAIEAKAIIY